MRDEPFMKRYRPHLFGIATVVLLLMITQYVAYQRHLIIKKAEQNALQHELDNSVSRFKEILYHKISSANTIAIIYKKNRKIDNFESIAKQIFAYDSSIDLISFSENNIVKYVYPLEGNQIILGHSLLEIPLFRKELQIAKNSKKILFAGPYQLTNGRGVGISCRIPIYENDSFVALVSVITKLPTILDQLPQFKNNTGSKYVFRLSKVNPVSGKTEFYFDGYRPLNNYVISAYIPEGNWTLQAAYSIGYHSRRDDFLLSIAGILFSFVVAFFVYYRAKLPVKLEKIVEVRTHELGERIKELHTIYTVNEILKDEKQSETEVFSNMVKILPFGWQYNKDCAAKIEFNGKDYYTDNYTESPFKQVAKFELLDGRKGLVEVIYTKAKPKEFEGCFLKEERDLINNIADSITVYFNKITQQKTLIESEAKFRGAFEDAAIGMALVSLEGKWLKVNTTFCKIVGYTRAELNELTFQQITHPDDLNSDLKFIEETLQNKRDYYRVEKRYLHKNGNQLWVNLNVAVVRNSSEQALYFISQIEDITEKKNITKQLKENEHLLRLFVEYSPASLAMFDMDMRYILTSKRWINDYKLDGKQVIGKSHYEVFPTIEQRWKDIHTRCLNGATEKCDEDSFIAEDGARAWLLWEIHPWYKASGEQGGIIMFTEVITDRVETRMKFQNLVEQSLVGVYIVQNGKFVYVNPRVLEETGYAEEELYNNTIDQFIYEEDVRIVQKNMQERLFGNVPAARYEVRVKVKGGDIIWMELFGSRTFYKGSIAIIGTMVNVTDKKNAYLELEKTTANLKSIFQSTNISYLLLDVDGHIIALNDYFYHDYKKQTGVELHLGDSFPDSLLPDKQDNFKNILRQVATTKQLVEYESLYTNRENARYFSTIISPVLSNGVLIGYCYSGMDITNRKNMELEREKIIDDLVQRNRDLEQFSQILSHNVRAPLSTILGLSSFINDEQNDDNDRATIIEGIDQSARQLDIVIKDLNEILNIKRDISELKTKVRLSDIVNEVKDMLRLPITTNQVLIETDFTAFDELESVRSYMHSILYNLISNAIKYRNVSEPPFIKIKSYKKEQQILISVKDNGRGIDLERFGDRLFGLYHRFHNDIEGKGMGLFMVKTQVDALQGKINVKSKVDEGTEFIISFNG